METELKLIPSCVYNCAEILGRGEVANANCVNCTQISNELYQQSERKSTHHSAQRPSAPTPSHPRQHARVGELLLLKAPQTRHPSLTLALAYSSLPVTVHSRRHG